MLSWDEMHSLNCRLPIAIAPIESRVLYSLLRSSTYAASPSFVSRDAAVIVLGAEQFCLRAAAPDTQQPSPASQNPASPEQATPGTESKANAVTDNATPNKKPAPEAPAIHNDVVIKGGTILTVTHGKIENGSIYIHNGKIAAVGQSVNAPAGATVIDATGKFVMPGIIDSHSHIALDDDVNEPTSPITPHMMMRDAFDYNDKAIYRALAGGVTTSLLLHGSANMIGGQAIVIKHKYGLG